MIQELKRKLCLLKKGVLNSAEVTYPEYHFLVSEIPRNRDDRKKGPSMSCLLTTKS